MTTSATIYGTPNQEMQVPFEFEYIVKRLTDTDEEGNWITSELYMINFVKLKAPLEFKPQDIDLDLEIAVAEKLNVEVTDVRIDCNVKYVVKKLQTVEI